MGHSTKSKRRPPAKVGRPSVYDPVEHPRLVQKLTAEGMTQAELAERFQIARSTLQEWLENHIEFSVAWRQGKEDATDRVERALLQRATGYEIDAIKPMVVSQGAEFGSKVELVPIKVHYAPDTAAASLWLKNRRPKDWKDKQEIEHTGKLTLEQILASASAPPEKPAQEHG